VKGQGGNEEPLSRGSWEIEPVQKGSIGKGEETWGREKSGVRRRKRKVTSKTE